MSDECWVWLVGESLGEVMVPVLNALLALEIPHKKVEMRTKKTWTEAQCMY